MTRDPRYDILFEPVRIGPKTARNRFYQVPHCTGSGHRFPHTVAALRGVKAEGGWAVVNTEWCSVHPSGDTTPTASARMWTDEDVRANAVMVDRAHEHGALVGCQLAHPGAYSHNRYTRLQTMGPSPRPLPIHDFPGQARAMDKSDIRDLLRWHRNAALRAIEAGFDILYAYSGHTITAISDFLSPRYNQRTDEYGGGLENRARLMREVLETLHEASAGRCAVAMRLCVDERDGPGSLGAEEGRAVVETMAELPDLWDVNVAGYNDILGSRYREEGWQESGVAFVKTVTTKPVVGVGRFTGPDAMVSQIERGVLDMIGAARPSIADPFLPRKIEEGRIDDIRECIGCNVCLASNALAAPIRCTQNPTISEEWRRGWHPERIPARGSDAGVLVVGAGPAGLEAARAAGARGYDVTLAEASRDLGGHLNAFATLPGFGEWLRVRDWRVGQIGKMDNVAIYRESRLDADDVVGFGAGRVLVATGSRWRRDGVGRMRPWPVGGLDRARVLTPDDVLADAEVVSPVVIYDDDNYVMGSALAELLAGRGHRVTIATPHTELAPWSHFTLERAISHRNLVAQGVEVLVNHGLESLGAGEARLAGTHGETPFPREAATVVLVTMREPDDALHRALEGRLENGEGGPAWTLAAIGDCRIPGLASEAVFAGHKAARELDRPEDVDNPFRVEQVPASFDPPLPRPHEPWTR